MAGAEDFCEIERWAKQKLDFLRRLLPFEKGVPSHDALNDVMNALPASLFSECFTNWVEALRETEPDIVAIDGKTSRRAHGKDGSPLHLVSAWASRQRLVLGQEAVDKKSNEIVAIPLLLERLELNGALVTIDAMGCQREIAEKIRAKGADYLLALKDNWPTLAEDVRLYFERERAACDVHETTDGDHGRIEVRRHYVSHTVDWLSTDRRFPGEPRFPALAMIGMIEATVERDGKTSVARRYYLSSALLSAKQFAHAARAHWGVENGLPYHPSIFQAAHRGGGGRLRWRQNCIRRRPRLNQEIRPRARFFRRDCGSFFRRGFCSPWRPTFPRRPPSRARG
jgi:predicted transposase YbfD/YdcC